MNFEDLDRIVDTSRARSILGARIGELRASINRSTEAPLLATGHCRVYLCHRRKTGGTSVIHAFLTLAGGEPEIIERNLARFTYVRQGPYRFVEHNTKLINRGAFFFAASHQPLYIANPPAESSYRITILRDPLERVLSLYRYLSHPTSDTGYAFRAHSEEREWAADGLDRFLDRLPREHLLNQLYGFSRSGDVAEAIDQVSSLDLVLRTESLAAGGAMLSTRLELPLHIGRERVSPMTATISEMQRTRVREMTDAEYRLLASVNA